jgi:hypothetical protein
MHRFSVLCFCLPLFLCGCSSYRSAVKTTSITAEQAYEVLDTAFLSCCYDGEMKYTINSQTLGLALLDEKDDEITFSYDNSTDYYDRNSSNLILDDILYSRVLDINRQNETTTISLVRSEPECYYGIEGITDEMVESEFDGITWTYLQAEKVDRSSARLDPDKMLYNLCFSLVDEIAQYDALTKDYIGCNQSEFEWTRQDQDGIVTLIASGKQGAALNGLYLDNYTDIEQVASSFDVDNAVYTIIINEDEQLVTITLDFKANYMVDGTSYPLSNTTEINYLAYSTRIPSYGTINHIISQLDFDSDTLLPNNDIKSFVY